jgi:hypothetical protein
MSEGSCKLEAVQVLIDRAPADSYKSVTESICGGQMEYVQEIQAELLAQAHEIEKNWYNCED